jgi:hypothetical protein
MAESVLYPGSFSEDLQNASASFQTTRTQPNNRSSPQSLLVCRVESVLIAGNHMAYAKIGCDSSIIYLSVHSEQVIKYL